MKTWFVCQFKNSGRGVSGLGNLLHLLLKSLFLTLLLLLNYDIVILVDSLLMSLLRIYSRYTPLFHLVHLVLKKQIHLVQCGVVKGSEIHGVWNTWLQIPAWLYDLGQVTFSEFQLLKMKISWPTSLSR